MTVQTFFNSNPHGIPGAGDCDDFVIAATAYMQVMGVQNSIYLLGKKKGNPIHISNFVKGGEVFDLTMQYYGEQNYKQRGYQYFQLIPVNL